MARPISHQDVPWSNISFSGSNFISPALPHLAPDSRAQHPRPSICWANSPVQSRTPGDCLCQQLGACQTNEFSIFLIQPWSNLLKVAPASISLALCPALDLLEQLLPRAAKGNLSLTAQLCPELSQEARDEVPGKWEELWPSWSFLRCVILPQEGCVAAPVSMVWQSWTGPMKRGGQIPLDQLTGWVWLPDPLGSKTLCGWEPDIFRSLLPFSKRVYSSIPTFFSKEEEICHSHSTEEEGAV